MSSSLEKKLTHSKYRPDIDGLRAIAVLAVLAFHAFPESIKGGFIGVDIFFVISGYLISTIIFKGLDEGTFKVSDFYARRIKRIFPALLLVMAACFTFGSFFLLADEYNQLGKHIAAGASFVSNLVFWNEAGYFDNAADTKPLLHLWSLGIEEQFYLAWPLLIWLAWKLKLNLLLAIILVAGISFLLNINVVKTDAVAAFYSPQTRFWELLTGSLLAWLFHFKEGLYIQTCRQIDRHLLSIFDKKFLTTNSGILPNLLGFCGILLLTYSFWRINKDASFPGKLALIPVAGSALIIAAGVNAFINREVLSNKVLVWFGLISFPLYLWHWPILSFTRIYENETPSTNIRIAAVALSVVLAWLTYKLIEAPIRSGRHGKVTIAILCSLTLIIGISGFIVYKSDLSQSHTYEKLAFKRKGSEHAFGYSYSWIKGKDDWLFLGNGHDRIIEKLKLTTTPTNKEIEHTKEIFSKISLVGIKTNTKIILIIAPNKSSIYGEYLPDKISTSSKRYISYFTNAMKDIPNLTVYDPTDDLLRNKENEGILYYRTNSHWNNKGAFLTYSGFLNLFGLPIPQLEFQYGPSHSGDLIKLSGLKDFPLHKDDNWNVIWKKEPILWEKEISNEQKTVFGPTSIVTNRAPLSNQYIWVIGDSFTAQLRQFMNATFKEVRYVGHWKQKIQELPINLENANRKPDMIIIIMAERFFDSEDLNLIDLK